jgi:hypothetical protein
MKTLSPRRQPDSVRTLADRGSLRQAERMSGGKASAVADMCAAAELLVAQRRCALGAEHPETLAAMLALADCLWAQGRLIAARRLEEAVVAGRRRVFGEGHVLTLKAIGKLAATLAAQGDLAAARQLQQEVVAGMRRLFGDDHRETLRALNNLTGTLAAAALMTRTL